MAVTQHATTGLKQKHQSRPQAVRSWASSRMTREHYITVISSGGNRVGDRIHFLSYKAWTICVFGTNGYYSEVGILNNLERVDSSAQAIIGEAIKCPWSQLR
jgi:hypothetical protein